MTYRIPVPLFCLPTPRQQRQAQVLAQHRYQCLRRLIVVIRLGWRRRRDTRRIGGNEESAGSTTGAGWEDGLDAARGGLGKKGVTKGTLASREREQTLAAGALRTRWANSTQANWVPASGALASGGFTKEWRSGVIGGGDGAPRRWISRQ